MVEGVATGPSPAPVSGFDPDDPDAWLVLGDWLSERGDPRGLIISLALTGEDPQLLANLRARHLHRYKEALWPVFGVSSEAGLREQVELVWIDGLVVFAFPLDRPSPVPLHDQLAGLLASEAAVALAELRGDRCNPVELVEVLLAGPPRPTIRALSLGDYVTPLPEPGALARLAAKLPGLRELALFGPGLRAEALVELAPRLTRLRLASELDPSAVAGLHRLSFPRLRALELRLGGERRLFGDADTDPSPWFAALLLEPAQLPALERLTIAGVGFGDRLVELLGRSPLLDRLRQLELSDTSFRPFAEPLARLDRPDLRLSLRGGDYPLELLHHARLRLGDRLV